VSEVRTLPDVAPRPQRVAFSPDGMVTYVSLLNPAGVEVIDTATNTLSATILIPDEHQGLVAIDVTPDGSVAYVATAFPGFHGPGTIWVVDLVERRIRANIPMPPCDSEAIASDLAITPDGKHVYVPVFGCTSTNAAAASSYTGDCDGDGQVTINELVLGVNIALGFTPRETCPAFDSNQDDQVTVDELVSAVSAALDGRTNPTSSGNFALVVDTRSNTITKIIDFGNIGPGATSALRAMRRAISAKLGLIPPGTGLSPPELADDFYTPAGTGIEITPDGLRA